MERILVCLTAVLYSDALRILGVFPMPSVSHQVVFRSLTQELLKEGHELVVITTHPGFSKGTIKNLTEIDVSELSLKEWNKRYIPETIGKNNFINTGLKVALNAVTKTLIQQLDLEEVRSLMVQKFDLVIVEAWIRPAMLWSYIVKAPVIKISSFGAGYGIYELMGAPTHPFLFPMALQQRIHNLSLCEKIRELYNLFLIHNLQEQLKVTENEMIKTKLEDCPSVDDLNANVDMFFVNIHPFWEGNRPVPLNVVHLGGLHLRKAEELPQDLQMHLDSSEHGVIFMSFGNHLYPSMVSPELLQMFLKVLSGMPYDVLLKWNDDLPGVSKNIRVAKWFPQFDLLSHPKMKLFITQGGQQSTDEAIEAGVPMVGIPLIADQWFNTDKYVEHGIGVKLDMETITEEDFRNAIYTVINDESYRSNIIRVRGLIRDSPTSPLHRAAWWTAHSSRLAALPAPPGTSLDAELIAMAATLLITILLAIFTILYYIVKFIVKVSFRRNMKKKTGQVRVRLAHKGSVPK